MKPSELASQLRRIASKIDKSRNPDRRLVARDLKKVLVSVDSDTIVSDDLFPVDKSGGRIYPKFKIGDKITLRDDPFGIKRPGKWIIKDINRYKEPGLDGRQETKYQYQVTSIDGQVYSTGDSMVPDRDTLWVSPGEFHEVPSIRELGG